MAHLPQPGASSSFGDFRLNSTAAATATPSSSSPSFGTSYLSDPRTPSTCLRRYTEPVTISVGPSQQKFTVYASLLTQRSPFFNKALNGNFTEAKDRIINLPEDDAHVFQVYVHLLYTSTIAISSSGTRRPGDIENERKVLASLYVMAEKFQDIATKNKAFGAVMGTWRGPSGGLKHSVDAKFVRTIYGWHSAWVQVTQAHR